MAKYLVTGGAGFIGRYLCRELAQAGHSVRVLDSLVDQAHGGNGTPPPEAVEFLIGDLRDPLVVREALVGVDGIFHLAAEVGVGQSMYEIVRYVSANDLGTAVLLQEAARRPVRRVVVASSMSVYGEGLYSDGHGRRYESVRRSAQGLRAGRWAPESDGGMALDPLPTDEQKRPDLASVYALSKYVQEQLTLTVCGAYGIEAVALRLFNVFGPGQALSNPYTGVLAIFAGRLLNDKPPLMFEDGEQRRDFVHVVDVARAFRLAMDEERAAGAVLNIGSGHSYTVAGVAELLARAMGREELKPRALHKARAGDIRHCFADISTARQVLGYRAEHLLEDRVWDFAEWVLAQSTRDRSQQAHFELEQRGLVV